MSNPAKPSVFTSTGVKFRLFVAIIVSVFVVSQVTTAQAQLTNLNGNEGRPSIIECTVLLIQDAVNGSAEHRPTCGVGENYQDNAPKTYSGASIGPVPVIEQPVKEEPVEEEPIEEEEECEHSENVQSDTVVINTCYDNELNR